MFKKYGFLLVLCMVPAIYWGLVVYSEDVCGMAHCVTVDDIKKSLKSDPPMSVGFDIDETVLFTSPVFYHVANQLCNGAVLHCMSMSEFWESANTLDSFSLPKHKGVELVRMHIKRGDKVYFITARNGTANEKLTDILRKLFNDPTLPEVIFTGYSKTENLKIHPIKENHIVIFYGDSDSDMEAATVAGARPIRILRAPNALESYTNPQIGAFNEEVVKDSEV